MKFAIIYRPNSEHARRTEEFITDFKRRNPTQRVEVINVDSRDGSAMATLYGVMQYPAILIIEDDGQIVHSWEGPDFPLFDEVAAYARL